MRKKNSDKALLTAANVSKCLGIPNEQLQGSVMIADGSRDAEDNIWYEIMHNGSRWELLREIDYLYIAEGAPRPNEGMLQLSATAFAWLAAKANGDCHTPII